MLRLPSPVRAVMIADLAKALPDEGCGLLLGHPESRLVARWWPCRNAHRVPAGAYMIHPDDHLAALRACDESTDVLRPIAVAHSHPTRPAEPSPMDLLRPTPEGWDAVIVSLGGFDPVDPPTEVEVRAWRWGVDGVLVEEMIRAK